MGFVIGYIFSLLFSPNFWLVVIGSTLLVSGMEVLGCVLLFIGITFNIN